MPSMIEHITKDQECHHEICCYYFDHFFLQQQFKCVPIPASTARLCLFLLLIERFHWAFAISCPSWGCPFISNLGQLSHLHPWVFCFLPLNEPATHAYEWFLARLWEASWFANYPHFDLLFKYCCVSCFSHRLMWSSRLQTNHCKGPR